MRAQKHEITIKCRNLDDVSSKAKIRTALQEQFKLEDFLEASIVSLTKVYGGTHMATIWLPVEAARKLLRFVLEE